MDSMHVGTAEIGKAIRVYRGCTSLSLDGGCLATPASRSLCSHYPTIALSLSLSFLSFLPLRSPSPLTINAFLLALQHLCRFFLPLFSDSL